ncbi:hypothetical protein EPUS_01538 [Endocarpon pusillum Z07020]|uniref:Uncharacterized protein n=1 Tax=Endocarpon pusillum (strain Z07020 / HMAS-L-300199) TaxID=1263415 RepID=U1GTI2_ENDPU|nr:uncharacterized protein EPUS_01538 [Endocarpon pusillum Z07020]ERF75708.1 hypothetical protein EPUS_01538 [Endocarpon pusillum Z07020]
MDVAATSANDNAINPFAKDEKNEDPKQIVPDIEQLAIDPHPIPTPILNNDEHKSEEDVDASDDEDGPTLTLPLEEDVLRKDHLFAFRNKTSEPVPTKTYRPSEQQLLQEGKLGDSHFSARLKKVKFGRYATETGERVPACLILVRVDFIPKSRGWFRFRDANVEVAFTDGPGAVSNRTSADDEDVDDDDDGDDRVYTGPLVLKFYPDLIRGHTQSASEQFNLSFNVPLAPLPAGSPFIARAAHGRAGDARQVEDA